MKKKELTILGVLFIVILGACFYIYTRPNEISKYGAVFKDKEEILRFDVEEDAVYEVVGNYGTMHIEVLEGKFRVFDVECPNHRCEDFGWVGRNTLSQYIICLPNGIEIVYVDENATKE